MNDSSEPRGDPSRADPGDFVQTVRFIVKVGSLANEFGVSSTQAKSILSRLGKALGVDVECFVASPAMFFVFSFPGRDAQRVHLAHAPSTNFDLGKLAKVTDLIQQIEDGRQNIDQAEASLDKIASGRSEHGNTMVALGYALCGAGFAMLLNGSWDTILLGSVLSVLLFAMTPLSTKWSWISQTLDLTSALLFGVIAGLAAVLSREIDPVVAVLAGVVVIIPGYSLTLGVAGITNGLLLSGMQRFVGGVMSTGRLFVGGWIGITAARAFFGQPDLVTATGQPHIVLWIGALLIVLGLGIVFQAETRDLGWIALGGLLAYAGTVLGEGHGVWQGPLLGSLLVGFVAAAFSHFTQRPASVVTLTAIMVLVPGASAILGVETAQSSGLEAGLHAEWHTFMVILAIIAGQVVANTLLSKKPDV